MIFTEKTVVALKALLAEDWPKLRPESAAVLAAKLTALV